MTAPTKKRCTELIRLCGSLDFFPADTAIRELLADTLKRRTVSDEHAERVIGKWLEEHRQAPKVSDIVEYAANVNPTPASVYRQPNRDCPECLGFGFKITERNDGISGASRCSNQCPIPTGGGDGASATPFNYSQERRQLTPHRPSMGSVRMRDIRKATTDARG